VALAPDAPQGVRRLIVATFKDTTFLFITSRSAGDTLGRVERRWLRVMKALVERGATVLVICPLRSPLEDRARALGATIAPYRMDKRNLVRTRSRLRKYLKRYRPVVAHATGFHADLVLRRAAHGLPVKVVVSLMCGKWPPEGRGFLSRLLRRRADARSLGRVDTFFVDCAALRSDLTVAGVSPERVVLDPPSVAVGRVADEATAPVARPHGHPLVGFAGALELNRGLETLVAAAPLLRQRYPHIGIVVAGDGPARASLEAAAADRRIDLMGPGQARRCRGTRRRGLPVARRSGTGTGDGRAVAHARDRRVLGLGRRRAAPAALRAADAVGAPTAPSRPRSE